MQGWNQGDATMEDRQRQTYGTPKAERPVQMSATPVKFHVASVHCGINVKRMKRVPTDPPLRPLQLAPEVRLPLWVETFLPSLLDPRLDIKDPWSDDLPVLRPPEFSSSSFSFSFFSAEQPTTVETRYRHLRVAIAAPPGPVEPERGGDVRRGLWGAKRCCASLWRGGEDGDEERDEAGRVVRWWPD
jgi:hypothetical protein